MTDVAGRDAPVSVRFWGVRGSLPAPGPETLVFGGNTACVEIRHRGRILILDAGSGLRALGDALRRDVAGGLSAEILLSHTHHDHLCGLGFFAPFYSAGNRLRIHAGHLGPGGLQAALRAALTPPLSPDLMEHWRSSPELVEFRAGEDLDLGGGVAARTAPLDHPGGATGYRIELGGRAVVYATDTEHEAGQTSDAVLRLARDADLLIYDATYTEEEMPARRGWGHSSWQEAVRIGRLAGVRRVALFHHDPGRDDAAMEAIERQAVTSHPGAFAAREGMVLEL